jgi:uncharacterized protein
MPGALTLLGLAFSGSLAGMMGAILGIGGGVFLIPALVLGFGIPMKQAVATGLVTVIATSSAVASVNVERGTANIRLGMVLELTTVLGALLGALIADKIPARALIALFGALMAVFTVLLWKRGEEAAEHRRDRPQGPLDGRYLDPATGEEVSYHVERLPVGLAVSLAAGSLSGLLGIGGGVFKVPVMHLYCGIPMKAAAATGNFMIGVTGAASAILYLGRGGIEPYTTAPVVLGVLLGSALGTRANKRLKDASVRRAFAVLLAFLSIQMLRRALHGS